MINIKLVSLKSDVKDLCKYIESDSQLLLYKITLDYLDIVHGCMVYTELAPRQQQFHVAPAMPALKYTTSVNIQKTRYWAIQRSLFARVHALCNLLLKKSREVAAHFRADF